MWLQIPFFCGHVRECWLPANEWALEEAKRNLVEHYLLVGLTEELHDFIAILEATLPQFFKGATNLYENGIKSHLRKTYNKVEPLPQTVSKIQESKIWKMENEFYEFALQQFNFIRQKTLTVINGQYLDKGQQFLFEKIRPR
jgi:heparan sulfate 2-O-sulfotransferase HS2ST1